MAEPREAVKLDETWARAATETLRHERDHFVEAVRELLSETNAEQSGPGIKPEAHPGE
jgi:hypothetical protein